MNANKITEFLESFFPLDLQMDFDCCGLQIGDLNRDVKQVYIALNADNDTLQKCIDNNCQMLITHHPFLLEEIKTLDYHKHQGKFIELAVKNNIIVYSLHTCLDQGKDGISMNDWLINVLGVNNIRCYDAYKIGKIANLNKSYQANEFIDYVKEVYNLDHLKHTNNVNKTINTVAICGGSGADDIEKLVGKVDCYITGDTKYRHAKYAIDNDILLIDPGHHLEVIFEEKMMELLKNLDIEIISNQSKDYYNYK